MIALKNYSEIKQNFQIFENFSGHVVLLSNNSFARNLSLCALSRALKSLSISQNYRLGQVPLTTKLGTNKRWKKHIFTQDHVKTMNDWWIKMYMFWFPYLLFLLHLIEWSLNIKKVELLDAKNTRIFSWNWVFLGRCTMLTTFVEKNSKSYCSSLKFWDV